MKLRLSLLAAVSGLALLIISPSGLTQFQAQTSKGKTVPCCGPVRPVAPRELDFPYYSLADGFTSTLYLVSDSPIPIPLTVTVRNLAGQAVFSSPTIQPHQKLPLDLRGLILEAGADPTSSFAEGSVSVYYQGTIMPVVGQVTMTNPVTHLVHESEMLENDPGRSDVPKVLNGLWWGLSGGRDARIMVSNTYGQAVVADVFLQFGGQSYPAAPSGLAFGAHETKVLSIAGLLGNVGFSPTQAPQGGITIIARGGAGGLIAQGKIMDPVTGFSTTLRFPAPDTQPGNSLHAIGVPLGVPSKDSPYFDMGNFVPHVVLRNMTNSVQTATLTVEYPHGTLIEKHKKTKGTYKEFDGESGENFATLTLPPDSLPAHSTQEILLDAALTQLPLPVAYASIGIQYTGDAGGVIAEVASVDAASDLVIDSNVINEGWDWAGSGANPWHLDEQTESILFLANLGVKPATIGFFVSANGVNQVLTQLVLEAHETRVINLRKFRDAQYKDIKGHRIDSRASDGIVTWQRASGVVAGRVVVINRRGGMASNYDCCTCCCYLAYGDEANFYNADACSDSEGTNCGDPLNVSVPVNGTVQIYAVAEFVDCNDDPVYDIDVTDSTWSTWQTSDSSIATVSDGGLITGVGAGSVSITDQYCDCTDWEPAIPGNTTTCGCNTNGCATATASVNVISGSITVNLGPPPSSRTSSFSSGDNLSFANQVACGATILGAQGCAKGWLWQVEVAGIVSDNAANWTVSQNLNSGSTTWTYTNLTQTTKTGNSGPDNPSSSLTQLSSGSTSVFFLDSPGPLFYSNILDIDDQATFTSQMCSSVVKTYCVCVDWGYHLIGDANLTATAGVVDTTNSSASVTRTSYSCQPPQ